MRTFCLSCLVLLGVAITVAAQPPESLSAQAELICQSLKTERLPPPLLEVSINPEGRVKLARGSAEATLARGEARSFLIRVENLSGGQQRLKPLSKYVGEDVNPFRFRMKKVGDLGAELLGLPEEYRLLEVTCDKPGRREITLIMEAGQGTQDLGFRAEVPVLFRVE